MRARRPNLFGLARSHPRPCGVSKSPSYRHCFGFAADSWLRHTQCSALGLGTA